LHYRPTSHDLERFDELRIAFPIKHRMQALIRLLPRSLYEHVGLQAFSVN
jgi:hypothetical protein